MEKKKVSRKLRFTKAKILSLDRPSADSKLTQYEYSDIFQGFKVFLPKGTGPITYHFRYTINGRKRIIKIGDFDCISVNEAREIAQKYRAMVSKKIDPLVERDKVKEVPTLAEFSVIYMEWAKAHKRSYRDDENKLKRDIIPTFGSRRLNEITSKEILDFLVQIKEKSSGAYSNRYRSLLSKLFSLSNQFSVFDGVNPVGVIPKFFESSGRLRYLSEDELKDVIKYLDRHKGNISALLLKFLLYTGLRLGESKKFRWSDINPDGTIHIRAENSKNKKARDVTLNNHALEVIRELQELRTDDNPYLFRGLKPGTHIVSPKKFFYTMKRKLKLDGVVIHSFRHTFSTLCISGNTDIYLLKNHLGHSDIKTTSIYSHLTPAKRKEAAENAAGEIDKVLSL